MPNTTSGYYIAGTGVALGFVGINYVGLHLQDTINVIGNSYCLPDLYINFFSKFVIHFYEKYAVIKCIIPLKLHLQNSYKSKQYL